MEFEYADDIELTSGINDEQLLELALKDLNTSHEPSKISDKIVINYILKAWYADGKESFSIEDVTNHFGKMMADWCLNNLAKKGLLEPKVDENGEISYNITEEGRKALQ